MSAKKSTEAADLSKVRNIGIAAHIDAGKTTLTERILFYTGASHKVGEVHEGTATMDFMAEEKAHGITIGSAVTQCPWAGHLIQVIDTPGHVDFTIEVERSMRVLDGAVIVMDGVRGVEPQTETVWRQASKFNVPRVVFVNKMDRPGASYERAMESMRRRLGANPVPVCVPLDDNTVLDLIASQQIRFAGEHGEKVERGPVPAAEADAFARWRETLLMAVAELEPDLEEAVLLGEDVPADRVVAALRKATLAGRAQPCFGGSALRNWGVQALLDGVLALLPAPLERPPAIARTPVRGGGFEETFVEMTPDGPLAALAFKVQLWEGRRHVFARIYRGTVEAGQEIRLGGKDQKERVARIFQVDADQKKRVESATAGDIVLFAGLRWATTGDTICAVDHEVLLERIDTKEPVLGLAVEPESSRDEEKMVEVLQKVCEEDPTVRFVDDKETGQRIIKGMGELHLQIIFERVEREFGLKLRAGKPRVMSRETIASPGEADVLVDRTFRAGEDKEFHLKARAVARVRPTARDAGIQKTVAPKWLPEGVPVPPPLAEAARLGVDDALLGGPVEGAPLQDVAVELLTVEIFPEGSTPQALRIATSQAVREAMQSGGGLVLRPIMRVEVVVPDENVGTVLGDLQSRGAGITGQESELGASTVHAECALDALLGYTTALRSLTKGRGQFTMEFSRFDAL